MSYSYYPSYVKRADRPCKNGLTCEYHLNGCCAHYHDDKAKTECLWGPHCAWRKSTCQYNHDGRYIDKPKLHPNQCKHKDKECSLNTQGRCLKYHKNQCEIECYHGAFCRYMDVVTKTGYICPYYHREAWKIFRKKVEKVINPNYVDPDEEERKRNIQNNINIMMSQQRLDNQHYQTFGHTDKTAPIPVSTKPAVNYTHVPAQQVYQHVNQPTQYIIHANTYTAAPIQYTGPQWILNQPKPSERIPLSYPPIQYAPASYPPPLQPLIEHSPLQHNTVKHASVQYAPVQHTPVQHTPVQYTPVQYTPVQYTPGQRALVQYALTQHAPTQHAPTQNALIQHNTVQHLPVQHTPVQHFPVKHHTPIQYNTVEQKPIETNKIEQKAVEYEAKQDNTKTYNINENTNDDEKEADESDQGPWSSEFYNEVMTAVERENAKT